VARQFGAEYDWDREILVTVGVSEAIDIALRTIVNPGDEVIYHEPCFVSYRPSIILAGGTPVCVETRREDQFRLTRPMLEKAVTKKTRVLMLNFPCNPTGAVLAKSDVEDIADFCIRHDLLLLTDEIYAELTYDSKHVSFVSVPGMKERTIFLHGMSKAWAMTGFRIGYACAPAEISENMMKLHQYAIMSAPTTGQMAAAEALERGDEAVAAMLGEYNRRRNYLIASFADMKVSCHTPAGAFYAFPYIGDLGVSSEDFAMRFLEEQSVAVVPGDAFGKSGAGFLRCAYATSMENIREAMKRMAIFVANIRAER
jgi:aminotransferase